MTAPFISGPHSNVACSGVPRSAVPRGISSRRRFADAARAGTAALAAAALLSGCAAAVLGGGAVATGTLLSSSERRSAATQEADAAIEAGATRLIEQMLAPGGRATATAYFRKVLLTGDVPSAQAAQDLAMRVRALPQVEGVVNELQVGPNLGFFDRSGDAYLTSKVRARLINQNGVPSGSVRTLSERGTVYLMGRLTPTEAQLATEVARQTDGVKRVVRVIDLIADAKGGAAVPLAPPARAENMGAALPANASVPGVVATPVTQPAIVNTTPAIEVQTLPPVR